MLKLILSTFLLMSTLTHATPYINGLNALEKGDFKEGVTQLSKVNKGHRFFLEAFKILQQFHYKKSQWSQLLARFAFYKAHYLNVGSQGLKKFDPNLMLLEVLALSKLCRWKDALIATKEIKFWSRQANITIPESVEKTDAYLSAAIRAQGFGDLKEFFKFEVKPITRDNFWKVKREQILKLNNPRYMRMTIKSKCNQ